MSWFTEIAGKAEDLLNRVDQSAATALQKQTKSSSYNSGSPYKKPSHDEVPADSRSSAFSTRTTLSSTMASALPSARKPMYSPGALTPKRKPESDDEKLMRFLNCNDTLPTPTRKTKPKTESPQKKQIPAAELASEEIVNTDSGQSEMEIPVKETPDPDVCDSYTTQTTGEVEASSEELQEEKTLDNEHPHPETTVSVDDSQGESETSNEELYTAHDRAQHAEGELKRMQKKLDHWNSQISGNDKVVRELREREKDMVAAMDAKDAQLAILKVRLQEADQELLVKKNLARDLEFENDRMIKEHAQSASLQNKTIEVMQEQLQKTEAERNKTQETLRRNQNEHMQKIGKMEEEHHHLTESYSSLQKKWNELNERSKELSVQLKQSNGNLEAVQQEYTDYKQKAQRILQSKEKLISSLKEGHLEVDSIERSEAASMLLNAEVEGMKQERDLIRDELRRANELVETYRSEIQELEKISQNDAITSQERCRNLQEQLSAEKTQKEELQLLNTQLKEESQILREDLTRTKSSFQSRVQDREIEIEKLRRQLTAKSLSTVSQDELESRLHALTENLIQKQTLVEALSTEKNSLVLQLERVEQQLREAQNYGLQQHTYVGINNNETERKAKTVFLENPFDSALTRKVKKVYGSIDSFSIRLGVFFRRYPITRVFVIVYMLLLHLWVMIVLLTYEPEIHNAGYDILKNQ